MGAIRWPWSLTGALLATTYMHSQLAFAGPSINVGLKAPFSSAPYLLELLETAAEENAESYFPLLDRIAEGHFAEVATDKELLEKFLQTLQDDNLITDPETLSSYQFALSTRSSAPRIEAHYQYYHTAAEPSLAAEQESSCPVWVLFNGKQYCSPSLDEPHGDIVGEQQTQELQFDRVLGSSSAPASILYADITSPLFGKFHKTLVKTAREGKTSYRIRHRKALDSHQSNPLVIPGYGVELALKRTDYIVIDDREDKESAISSSAPEKEVKFEEEEVADLKPLSTSELSQLGLKTSSFVLQSENPFDTLIKLSQDFPKYSSAIASHSISEDFLKEHQHNRAQLVPAGYNVWWMNGIQMTERNIGALSILDALRRERKLINGVRGLGITGSEAVKVLSHTNVSYAKVENEVQRFDWRDTAEGENVIIWLNDITKDTRYDGWPTSLSAFLQRTYPGQLPQVRRECFDIILPVDFSKIEDVYIIVDTLISFVKRKLSIRIGLVPLTVNDQASEQAKVIYHLLDTYGLSAVTTYLENSYNSKKLSAPDATSFTAAIEGKKTRKGLPTLTLTEALSSEDYNVQIGQSKTWVRRLSADSRVPPMFVDGAALPRDENWLQSMSQRVTADLQLIQQGIFQDEFTEESWLPEYFLSTAVAKRNSLVTPEDEKSLKIFDVGRLYKEHKQELELMPRLPALIDQTGKKSEWVHLVVIVDLDTQEGDQFLTTATYLRQANPSLEITIVHNPASAPESHSLSNDIFVRMRKAMWNPFQDTEEFVKLLNQDWSELPEELKQEAHEYWHKTDAFVQALSILPGQNALLLNGRLVGPIPNDAAFDIDDFEQLFTYERTKRIYPAFAAIDSLGLSEKILDPFDGARLSSLVAISTISDAPEGIFEAAPTMRMSQFDIWNTTHTTIQVGDPSTASIQMNVLVDPASQQGQRWIPILKVLSELEGVSVRVYLNPKERLSELPIKRFYRYVLDARPTFDHTGSLLKPSASFKGVPQDALLTVGMDVPPAWLVAPKVSVHDLDNIKLSSTKGNVEALYELEHILIEGHSRETPGGGAPRGAQLVLGTERDPHTADTIIMANLGYFQFKANPGYYKIDLLKGRSSEIFHIDSVGALGYSAVPGDENTEVVLMSFQGATIYPRLSRKAGMETEDVLEAKPSSKMDFVSRGLNFAQGILGKGKTDETEHADINIFSVASGHLYERMLNIMMVSVMKHTKHTVKFWFIEQFLSPSFKDFIPHLAAEYGFQYELVTYKWPHWLRSQSEKQREIWGYKILFLDVLFPLSLDKVIFVDADQIVRTDMMELVSLDLKGAPYGFTPMCDSRIEMEGFRFWKQGYWEKFLSGLPYHISALYVVDLQAFRQIAAGDRLRQQYHSLSADPNSLSNLDQDLPNHMQSVIPIHSLPQEWLWCETWCSDESLGAAKTIDLCNNPMTKEPKLDRARRQVPEWTIYDDEIAAVDRKRKGIRDENKTEGEEPVKTHERDEL